ncbi:MAG: NAD(P)-dependent alcohol dehydrogenase [Propionibacteriaceae bacterium]|nr:NAD(P)-dependent alcohol dehydrogenase [Propionibacteriaceae bacterium]
MTTTVRAWAAPGAGEPLEPITITRRDLRPDDIRIKIVYAGICHSDIHTVRGEWGARAYPIAPGHEIAGEVVEVGSAVTKFQIGDRAGVGCMVDSCGECEACADGEEQYCSGGVVWTYASEYPDGEIAQGGYSQEIVVTERFALHIPESIPYPNAAPLLCAGITTYSPLEHWGVGPDSKVAVVGLGGLGHMGVQIAKALGAEVTVLSQSDRKAADSKRFGAVAHRATADRAVFRELRESFDFVLNTVSAGIDLGDYLGLLRRNGVLVNVGMPTEALPVILPTLIGRRRSLSGSNIGGIAQTQRMLDFCAEHGIAAEVEVIGAEQINEAYDRVVNSDVRYRFVIDTETL